MNAVTLKPGVTFAIVTPGLIRILGALDQVSRDMRLDLVISCGNEAHPPGDVHTLGRACDVSVHNLSVEQLLEVRGRLMTILQNYFTVLYERADTAPDARLAVIAYINAGATAPHLHLQVKNGASFPPIATTTTPAAV